MTETLFVSNRDIVVRSAKAGMSIAFTKGKPQHVPRIMHDAVMDKGILPVEASGEPVKPDSHTAGTEPEKPKLNLPPEDGEERRDQLIAAIKNVVARNNSKDFTAGGQPAAGALTAMLGWRVDQKEIRVLWNEKREEFKVER